MILPPERRPTRLPLARIRPDPLQPRKDFDWDKLKELAASIRSNGQWVRVIVRPDPDRKDDYLLIDGERRWRAMPLVPQDAIDAEIVDGPLDPGQLLMVQTSLGLTGQRLEPLEMGEACTSLMRLYDLAPCELAERLGISEGTISKLLRILNNLAEVLRADVRSGALPFTVAYEIARLKDSGKQVEVAEKVKAGLLKRDSVRTVVNGALGKTQAKARVAGVKVKTAKGIALTVPGMDLDAVLAELAVLVEAVRKLQRHALPLSSLPNVLKA